MKAAPFKSDFAILDVKAGRSKLAKVINSGGKVRLRVDLVLDCQHSGDDGTSIEFSGVVQDVRMFKAVEKPRARKRRIA